jgi:fluoride ion exporter CrcB/FEX
MAGLLGGFGALVNYLWAHTQKGYALRWGVFFINVLAGFWLGVTVGEFLEPDMAYRDGMLLVAGFVCHPALLLIEKQGAKWIANRVTGQSK